jgi:hypothetical protein
MIYELRAGWNRAIELFTDEQEDAFAARWLEVQAQPAAGAWQVDATGTRWGTLEPGEHPARGRYIGLCWDCGLEFTTPAANDALCVACLVAVRPAELWDGVETRERDISARKRLNRLCGRNRTADNRD